MADLQDHQLSFPEAVFLRPRMYTHGGTFGEIIAFLDGYYSGMAKVDPDAPPVDEWAGFREWLARKLDAPWSEVLDRLIQVESGGDGSRAMLEHIQEFRASGK